MDTLFVKPEIKILSDSDFTLETEFPMLLKNKNCCIVLFHDNSEKSVEAMNIWKQLSQMVAGPVFMVCDLIVNRGVSNSMASSSYNTSSPYSWISLVKVPVIFVYRQGYPKGVFNQMLTFQNLLNYSQHTACNPSYVECQIVPEQSFQPMESSISPSLMPTSDYSINTKQIE